MTQETAPGGPRTVVGSLDPPKPSNSPQRPASGQERGDALAERLFGADPEELPGYWHSGRHFTPYKARS